MFDHLTEPRNDASEQALCALIIMDPEKANDIVPQLPHEAFWHPIYRAIWKEMGDAILRGGSHDLVTLSQALEEQSVPNALAVLGDCVSGTVTALLVNDHLAKVKDAWKSRQAMTVAMQVIARTQQQVDAGDKIISEATNAFMGLAGDGQVSSAEMTARDVSQKHLDAVETSMKRGAALTGIPTGFPSIDAATGGLQRGELAIVAARPSQGKSAFALNMAIQSAEQGIPVCVFSLEMTAVSLADRIYGSMTDINTRKFRSGKLTDAELMAYQGASVQFANLPIIFYDIGSLHVRDFTMVLNRIRKKHGVELVIVDYIQLMHGSNGKSSQKRHEEVGEISRAMKLSAMRHNISIVGLSQLNRDTQDGEPKLHQLRESGSLEQDADVAFLLYTKSQDDQNMTRETQVHVAKQRNGPTPKLLFKFDMRAQKFTETPRVGK